MFGQGLYIPGVKRPFKNQDGLCCPGFPQGYALFANGHRQRNDSLKSLAARYQTMAISVGFYCGHYLCTASN